MGWAAGWWYLSCLAPHFGHPWNYCHVRNTTDFPLQNTSAVDLFLKFIGVIDGLAWGPLDSDLWDSHHFAQEGYGLFRKEIWNKKIYFFIDTSGQVPLSRDFFLSLSLSLLHVCIASI